MTLAVAWERTVGARTELLFASDSRVRQGGEWDTCPKIFQLPRSDALIAFAGDTLWTYPIILQTIATMAAFEPSRSRRYSLAGARGHAMRTMNAMMRAGSAVTGGLHEIEFEFLFGGWSWEKQRFDLWRLYWSPREQRMRHDTVKARALGLVRFIGTRDREHRAKEDKDMGREVVGTAKARLSELLRQRAGHLAGPLDMEPWEVLVELLRSRRHNTLGGPPQLAKVYRFMHSELFAVRWPDAAGNLTLTGRKLLSYERTDARVMVPDPPWFASGIDDDDLEA